MKKLDILAQIITTIMTNIAKLSGKPNIAPKNPPKNPPTKPMPTDANVLKNWYRNHHNTNFFVSILLYILFVKNGTSDRNRTYNRQIRNLMLYPVELLKQLR